MRKLNHLGLMLLISLILVACGSNSDDDGNNNDDTAQFVVDVDGVRKEIGFANGQYSNDGRLVLVSGITGFGDPNGGFALGVSVGTISSSGPVITAGTYNSSDSNAKIIFTPGGEEPFESNSTVATAEIIITEINTNSQTISGTFEGTVKRADETMELTNGEFNEVSYN